MALFLSSTKPQRLFAQHSRWLSCCASCKSGFLQIAGLPATGNHNSLFHPATPPPLATAALGAYLQVHFLYRMSKDWAGFPRILPKNLLSIFYLLYLFVHFEKVLSQNFPSLVA